MTLLWGWKKTLQGLSKKKVMFLYFFYPIISNTSVDPHFRYLTQTLFVAHQKNNVAHYPDNQSH